MSWEAQQWAYEHAPMTKTARDKDDATARSILAALAYHADSDGRNSYAGPTRLRFETGYDQRTIKRALERLQAEGLISARGRSQYGTTCWDLDMTKRRPASDWEAMLEEQASTRAAVADRVRAHRARKAQVTDSVTVTQQASVTDSESPVTQSESVTSGPVTDSVTVVTDSEDVCNALNAPQTTQEPPNEPPLARERAREDADTGLLPGLLVSLPERRAKTQTATDDLEAEFAEWWNAYPHKRGGRTPAFRAYAKARKGQKVYANDPTRTAMTAEQLLTAVRLFGDDMRRTRRPVDKIPYGSTWLNGDEAAGYLRRAEEAAQRPRRVVNGPVFEGY